MATTNAATAATTATGATTDASSGNAALTSSFQTAIQQAQQTLTISTNGEAILNALKARPQ